MGNTPIEIPRRQARSAAWGLRTGALVIGGLCLWFAATLFVPSLYTSLAFAPAFDFVDRRVWATGFLLGGVLLAPCALTDCRDGIRLGYAVAAVAFSAWSLFLFSAALEGWVSGWGALGTYPALAAMCVSGMLRDYPSTPERPGNGASEPEAG